MWFLLRVLVAALRLVVRSRTDIVLENIAFGSFVSAVRFCSAFEEAFVRRLAPIPDLRCRGLGHLRCGQGGGGCAPSTIEVLQRSGARRSSPFPSHRVPTSLAS